MAVKIRLSRIGTTNRPFYRLIAVDGRKKRDGAQLANLGTFDPVNGVVVQFHEELYNDWLSKGALATDSAKKVYKIFKKTGCSDLVSAESQEKNAIVAEQAIEEIA